MNFSQVEVQWLNLTEDEITGTAVDLIGYNDNYTFRQLFDAANRQVELAKSVERTEQPERVQTAEGTINITLENYEEYLNEGIRLAFVALLIMYVMNAYNNVNPSLNPAENNLVSHFEREQQFVYNTLDEYSLLNNEEEEDDPADLDLELPDDWDDATEHVDDTYIDPEDLDDPDPDGPSDEELEDFLGEIYVDSLLNPERGLTLKVPDDSIIDINQEDLIHIVNSDNGKIAYLGFIEDEVKNFDFLKVTKYLLTASGISKMLNEPVENYPDIFEDNPDKMNILATNITPDYLNYAFADYDSSLKDNSEDFIKKLIIFNNLARTLPHSEYRQIIIKFGDKYLVVMEDTNDTNRFRLMYTLNTFIYILVTNSPALAEYEKYFKLNYEDELDDLEEEFYKFILESSEGPLRFMKDFVPDFDKLISNINNKAQEININRDIDARNNSNRMVTELEDDISEIKVIYKEWD